MSEDRDTVTEIIEETGWSQAACARIAGCSPLTIWKILQPPESDHSTTKLTRAIKQNLMRGYALWKEDPEGFRREFGENP